jgi:DNA-binding HxlR family transcriptional regulator
MPTKKTKNNGVVSVATACPVAQASWIIGDMWILLIIRDLLVQPRRFNELQQSLIPCSSSSTSKNTINSRTLTNRLKMLEKADIINRTVFPHEMPPKVEYSLTSKGKALSEIIRQIRNYGKKYF